jgi:hypothetical protein
MTDDRDPRLQALFADTQVELDGEEFIAGVMAKTRKPKQLMIAGLAGLALLLVAGAWLFSLPTYEITQFIATALTTTLIDMGEGWAAWILSPVNNIASVLILSLKGIRMIQKKVRGVSYLG